MRTEFRHRASATLNALLGVTAVVLALHAPTPVPAKIVALPPAVPVLPPVFVAPAPQYPASASASDQRRWLVDQLRSLGVPNQLLARIVLEHLDKGWNQRGAALALKCHGNPDTMAAFQLEINLGKDAEMRAALGEAGFYQWDHENMLREVNQGRVPLSAAETGQSYDLWKKLQQQELGYEQAKQQGTMDDADLGDAQAQATSEFNQQMKALLGDARYAKSQQLDNGSAALSSDLASANPSPTQFQTLMQSQQQWNDQRAALDQQFKNDPSSADYAAQLKALNDARDQQYQQVLGADAFDTLQKSQDPGYSQMKKYETLWGLNDNQVDSVYGSIKYYDQAVQDYQAQVSALQAQGQAVDMNEVNQNLQQFASQSQQALQNYVGADTFNQMQRNGVFQYNPPALLQHTKPSP